MADFKHAIIEAVVPTVTGNVDYTSVRMGGQTPKAAIIIAAGHVTQNDGFGGSGGMIWSIGYCSPSFCFTASTGSQDAVGTSNVGRRSFGDNSIRRGVGLFGSGMTGYLVEGRGVTFIAGGVRINWNLVAGVGATPRLWILLLGGSDLSVAVGAFTLPSNTTGAVSGLGFQPDAVLSLSCNASNSDSTSSFHALNFGIAERVSGIQRGLCWAEADNIAAGGQPTQILDDDSFALQVATGSSSIDYTCTLSSFDVGGFTVTTNATAAANDTLGYMALKVAGVSMKLIDFTTPTATGNTAVTGLGFRPGLVLACCTSQASLDTAHFNDDDATGAGITVFNNASEQGGINGKIRDNSDPTSATCNSQPKSIMCSFDGTINAIAATHVSMDSDGYTLNYGTVLGSGRRGFALAFQDTPITGSLAKTLDSDLFALADDPTRGFGILNKTIPIVTTAAGAIVGDVRGRSRVLFPTS